VLHVARLHSLREWKFCVFCIVFVEVSHASVTRRPLRGLLTSSIAAASHHRMWMESIVWTAGRSHSVCN